VKRGESARRRNGDLVIYRNAIGGVEVTHRRKKLEIFFKRRMFPIKFP